MNKLSKRYGKYVSRTRPYYELKQNQEVTKNDIQLAVKRYEDSTSILNYAREEFNKLEGLVVGCNHKDQSVLEKLNYYIMKVSYFLY